MKPGGRGPRRDPFASVQPETARIGIVFPRDGCRRRAPADNSGARRRRVPAAGTSGRAGSHVKRHVHYEAAFEDYLRVHRLTYVAVDEAKRAAFREAQLKSFDFIVYGAHGGGWLADIKGRRWATRRGSARPTWENWVTQADLDGLVQWQEVFGVGYAAVLIFAYSIDAALPQPPAEVVHRFGEKSYVFAGVPLDVYVKHARLRSPRWGTVNLPVRDFAACVRPVAELLEA